MAFDGFTTAAIRSELARELTNGYISKVVQPETDELLLTLKTTGGNKRLLLSASPSLPLAYLTETNRQAPLSAPAFCMLLRKHIGGGKILSVEQPSLERILIFLIEHHNEMGDLCRKKLIVELMGKHSNIIFTDENDLILDSIRRIPGHVSSVREVLPGKTWFIPNTQEKYDPFTADEASFENSVFVKPSEIYKAIYTTYTGFSPAMAEELCCRAGIDGRISAKECEDAGRTHLAHTFVRLMEDVKNEDFSPVIFYDNNVPTDFSPFKSERYPASAQKPYASISSLLADYYTEKEQITRIRQKSSDLRRIAGAALERSVKKLNLQQKQLADTEKMDKYRIYGELLNTYGYECEPGAKKLDVINYYTNEPVSIPLDPLFSASDNAKKYFDRYNKLKRTAAACEELIAETSDDIRYLDSIQTALELATDEADLAQIKQELTDAGYIRKHTSSKKGGVPKKSSPLHYISSDGFDIYVGKNNYQNDELTFHLASGNDWWFHAKQMPGSHVILRTDGKELPDRAFEEAASLAAYYSKGKQAEKVEIDYIQKKHIKKPNKAKPGFVVYYTNYSMMARPCIDSLTMVK